MLGGILFMNKRRIAALQAGLLFVTVFANAASKIAITMRIKVLSSESQTVVLDDSGVPKASISTRIAIPARPRK
jgi:hypothetical protein